MKKKNTSKLLIFTLFLFCTPTEDLEVVELNEKINNCIPVSYTHLTLPTSDLV